MVRFARLLAVALTTGVSAYTTQQHEPSEAAADASAMLQQQHGRGTEMGRRLLYAGETDPCYSPARYGSATDCPGTGYICPNDLENELSMCTVGRPSPICLYIMVVDGRQFDCSWYNGACWAACGWGSHDGRGYRREYCLWHGSPNPIAYEQR